MSHYIYILQNNLFKLVLFYLQLKGKGFGCYCSFTSRKAGKVHLAIITPNTLS